MPVEILKASVGDYSVNTSKRGVTVNQQYLGDRDYNWGPTLPVHKWYLANPKATVAQVAEQLDKLPKEVVAHGYQVGLNAFGTLCVLEPEGFGLRNPSKCRTGPGDDCIQHLRKQYNGDKSTDVAECARLIEGYFNPSSIEVQGYKVTKSADGTVIVYQPGERQSYWSPARMKWCDNGPEAIKHLRKHTTRDTTVRETAKLIEDFLSTKVVKGITVRKGAHGTEVIYGPHGRDLPGIYEYLNEEGYQSKPVAEVAKLIEDYKFTKVTVETEAGKKELGSVNDAMVDKDFKGGVTLFVDTLGNDWHYLGFSEYGILFNHTTQVTKTCRNIKEAKQYIQDKEIPF